MYNLLVILFSLYPTIFLFRAIPDAYISMLDNFATSDLLFFVSHTILFGLIFFLVFSVFKKFITVGFMNMGKTNFLGLSLISLMLLAIITIVFYQVLPGEFVYASPKFVDDFILKQPFSLIILILPFAYLFFD